MQRYGLTPFNQLANPQKEKQDTEEAGVHSPLKARSE